MPKVKVILDSKWAYIGQADKKVTDQLRKYWSFYPPGYRWAPKFRQWEQAAKKKLQKDPDYDTSLIPGWDGTIKLFQRGRVPSGLFRATRWDVESELGITFSVRYDRTDVETKAGFTEKDERYLFQNECVNAMLGAVRKGGGIVIAATGTGKTKTASQFFSRIPYISVFLVDTVDLLYQSQREIQDWLKEPVGVVGDQRYELNRVTVATVQTLKRHLNDATFKRWFKTVKIVLVDELHDLMARKNYDLINSMPLIAKFGLTATLQLTKKEVRYKAYAFCGPVIFRFPLSEGVRKKVLTPGEAIQLGFIVDHQNFDDWREEYQENVIENEAKLSAVRKIVRWLLSRDESVVVLCDRIDHVKLLSKTFSKIPHRVAYGAVGKAERVADRNLFEEGGVNLIIANKVFKKGINVKRLSVVIDMAEQRSKNDTQQKFGRGVRLHKTKEKFRYIDISTLGSERYRKAGVSRYGALRDLRIPVKKVVVESPNDALTKVKKFLGVTE